MLKNRVSSINNLDYQEIAIDERKVVSTLKQVLPLLQKPEPAFTNRVAHIDIADMEEIAVQRWLYSLDLKCERPMYIGLLIKKAFASAWMYFSNTTATYGIQVQMMSSLPMRN